MRQKRPYPKGLRPEIYMGPFAVTQTDSASLRPNTTHEPGPQQQPDKNQHTENYNFSTEPNTVHGWTQPRSISDWDPAD